MLSLSQVLVETTGGDTTRCVFGQDLLAEQDGVAWAYHLGDGLGSVRQLADEDGRVTLAQSYTPFGEPLWSEGNGSTGFGFTGSGGRPSCFYRFLRLQSNSAPTSPVRPRRPSIHRSKTDLSPRSFLWYNQTTTNVIYKRGEKMAEIVTAVYEQGVLRPLRPLGLKEHQRVRLQVLPEPPEKVEHAIRALIQAGLLTPPPGHSEVPPLSEQERRELSELLGRVPGKPLSEIIIEERGEW